MHLISQKWVFHSTKCVWLDIFSHAMLSMMFGTEIQLWCSSIGSDQLMKKKMMKEKREGGCFFLLQTSSHIKMIITRSRSQIIIINDDGKNHKKEEKQDHHENDERWWKRKRGTEELMILMYGWKERRGWRNSGEIEGIPSSKPSSGYPLIVYNLRGKERADVCCCCINDDHNDDEDGITD